MYLFQKWYSMEILSVYLLILPSTYSRANIHASHCFFKTELQNNSLSLAWPHAVWGQGLCVVSFPTCRFSLMLSGSYLCVCTVRGASGPGLNGWAVSLYYYTFANWVCSSASVPLETILQSLHSQVSPHLWDTLELSEQCLNCEVLGRW